MAVCRSIEIIYPPFARALLAGISRAKEALNVEIRIFETYRAPSRQEILYAQGRSTPGKIVTSVRGWGSWHQYGLAADIALWINGKWSWDFAPEVLAQHISGTSLRWGGAGDGPHYQWKNLPDITLARKICKEGDGVLSLWSTL